MKRIITAALAALALAAPTAAVACEDHDPPAPPPAAPTSVFVVAHQDDELVGMGATLRKHTNGADHVVVVVATDGSATGAVRKIGAKLGVDWTTISKAELTAHRDAEFMASCAALGADECLVAPAGLRMPDRGLTDAGADAIMAWAMATWPGAKIKTHSYLIGHTDHQALGRALKRGYDAGAITDARFHISHRERNNLGTAAPNLMRHTEPVGDTEQDSYRRWAPPGWWSVGYLSAGDIFDWHRADPTNWVHGPNA